MISFSSCCNLCHQLRGRKPTSASTVLERKDQNGAVGLRVQKVGPASEVALPDPCSTFSTLLCLFYPLSLPLRLLMRLPHSDNPGKSPHFSSTTYSRHREPLLRSQELTSVGSRHPGGMADIARAGHHCPHTLESASLTRTNQNTW